MADKSVFIEGIAEGAFDELPEWATEKTALELEKFLRKSYDVQTKMLAQLIKSAAAKGQALSPEEMKKVNDEVEKFGRSMKRNNEEDAKAFKRKKDKAKQEENDLNNGKKKSIGDALLTKTLAGLTAVGGKTLNTYKEYLGVYDSLYTSGINVLNGNNSTANGFEALNQMVNLTGVRLETFQKVAEKYTSAMNVVGVTKFSKAINASADSFRRMGYSSEQQLELMASMMESETGFMAIQNKSSLEMAKDAERLGYQLDRLSKTVGISREQLQENIKESNKSANAYMIDAKYGSEARKTFMTAISGFPKDLQKMFIEVMATDSPEAQAELIKQLNASGLGDVGQQIIMILKGGLSDVNAVNKGFEEVGKQLHASGRMLQLGGILDQEGKAGSELMAAFMQHAGIISKASASQEDNAQKTQASVAKFNSAIEEAASLLQAMFFPLVSQVNAAADVISAFNKAVKSQITAENAEERSWIGLGVAIAGFIAGLVVGKNIIGSFTKGVGNFSSFLSGVGNSLKWLGGMLFRIATPLLLLYSTIQLATSIGETISEMVLGIEGTVDYIDAIKTVAGDLWAGLKGIWNSIAKFASEIGSAIGKHISKLSEIIYSAGLYLYNGIIGIGKKIIELFPWIGTIGEYIQKAMSVIGSIISKAGDYIKQAIEPIAKIVNEIIEYGKSYIDVLKDFVRSVLSKFANKMSFGLIGGDKDKSPTVQGQSTSASTSTKSGINPIIVVATPQGVAVPNSPESSKIAMPTPQEIEKAVEKELSTDEIPTPLSDSKTLNNRPLPHGDINNLLSYQGSILEQILLSTNDLVSVNKDILRYARNGV